MIGMTVATPSALPGLLNGWNASVGDEHNRAAAEATFNVRFSDNEDLWLHNALTPYVGRTMKIVAFDVIDRTATNTMMEVIFKVSPPVWTFEPGCASTILGRMVERIPGPFGAQITSGITHIAGYASSTVFVVHDDKMMLGMNVYDWGLNTVTETTKDSVTIEYYSPKKGKFRCTWKDVGETSAVFIV